MSHDPFSKYESVEVPNKLSDKILKSSRARINPNAFQLSIKYAALFMTSTILSLTVCPQWGFGLVEGEFLLFPRYFHNNEILCGLYCGLIFFLTTHLLSFSFLNSFERVKIIKKVSYMPALFFSMFFAISMTSAFSNESFGITYSISWALIVGLLSTIFNTMYRRRFAITH